MEVLDTTILLLDLSPEVLQLIADVCLETPSSIAALAETCSTLYALIYQQETFWKRNIRKIFGVDVAQWSSAPKINWLAAFTNLWRFKYQPKFFKFEPYEVSKPKDLAPRLLERSGHTAHLVGERILVVGGAGRAWHQHHDVLEVCLNDEDKIAYVEQIMVDSEQQIPWLSWSHYDSVGHRIFTATGDVSEANLFEMGESEYTVKRVFDLRNRAEVACISGAGQVVLEESNELLLIGGRYSNIRDPICTIYKLKFVPGQDSIESEVLYPAAHRPIPTFDIPRRWMQSQSEFDTRWCPAALRLDHDRVLIFGGWLDMDRTFLNDVKIFSRSTRKMETMECTGEIPPPRCQVGAFLVQNNRYLVVYGGAYRKQRKTPDDELVEAYGDIVRDVDEIYVLDLELQHWVCAAARGPISSVHTCTKMSDNQVIIIGGMHSDPGTDEPHFHNAFIRLTLGSLKK
eukprot:TRINITY_DN3624_c0_g1_i1.p1 TRINITY_DN3624_c0_g1~~TRINITY_DN3624_c0_g1_i1.p1  ORF type:complete len:457 (+),score=47.90 TRINITY_DN3624_c0_g1_i1:442-1812(+)